MSEIPRRQFLRHSVGVGAASMTFATPVIRATRASVNEQIVFGMIGFNGMGGFHVRTLSGRKDVRIAYLCDIDKKVRDRASELVKSRAGYAPKHTEDFRDVLADDSVDAVVVATPHHWHCPIAIRALIAGKDLYIEKPASHVFQEGRLLVQAARKYERIVQHGTQMRTSAVTEQAGEVLASGILGEIKMSKAWNVQRLAPITPRPDGDVPKNVNYDMWLGPAPIRPFNANRFHRT